MRTASHRLDAITLEILSHGLRSVVDEAFYALMRSAYSTNIKERRDHSTGLLDAHGRLVAQAAESLPIHLAAMSGMVAAVLDRYGDDLNDGDIFVANDPHTAGGTHLPDVNMAQPIFADGELLGFVANLAHHADIGGAVPGSMAGGLSEIYQEGLRIPALRLVRAGELRQDILALLLLNQRVPDERRGDYFAQIAACRLGARRMGEVAASYGAATLAAGFGQLIEGTRARLQAAIAALPDGTYRCHDVMDDDGLGNTDLPIALSATVGGDSIDFDFTASADQTAGNINVTRNATEAAVCYALKALLDPELDHNDGVLAAVTISTRPGSLLDAGHPAPVAGRAHTCQRIVDVILGALAPARPEQAVAAGNGANTTAVFTGTDPRSGARYVYLETLGGGGGGRYACDGSDGVQVHITNTSNLPVEAIEMEYPLRVEAYGLSPDSGGAGRARGGLGLTRTIRPLGHSCSFNGAGERFRHAPWGLFGGASGGCGRFVKQDRAGNTHALATKPNGVAVSAEESLTVTTPGAGGYGPPAERAPDALAEDLASGKATAEAVAAAYGRRLLAAAEAYLSGDEPSARRR